MRSAELAPAPRGSCPRRARRTTACSWSPCASRAPCRTRPRPQAAPTRSRARSAPAAAAAPRAGARAWPRASARAPRPRRAAPHPPTCAACAAAAADVMLLAAHQSSSNTSGETGGVCIAACFPARARQRHEPLSLRARCVCTRRGAPAWPAAHARSAVSRDGPHASTAQGSACTLGGQQGRAACEHRTGRFAHRWAGRAFSLPRAPSSSLLLASSSESLPSSARVRPRARPHQSDAPARFDRSSLSGHQTGALHEWHEVGTRACGSSAAAAGRAGPDMRMRRPGRHLPQHGSAVTR